MTKEDIHVICKKYNITNYIINDDLSIDVNGSVDLSFRKLDKMPLKFRNVTGWFDCSYANLKSLEGGPSYIGGNYFCDNNHLTSLDGVPSSVVGYFGCSVNPLESLKGIPLNISSDRLYLPKDFTYSDYIEYCKVAERDLKFKKLLK